MPSYNAAYGTVGAVPIGQRIVPVCLQTKCNNVVKRVMAEVQTLRKGNIYEEDGQHGAPEFLISRSRAGRQFIRFSQQCAHRVDGREDI